MANWQHKVKLRDVLDTYEPQDTAEAEKAEIVRVRSALMERMREYPRAFPTPIVSRFAKVETEAAFNRAMDDLYDHCDRTLVWVEP